MTLGAIATVSRVLRCCIAVLLGTLLASTTAQSATTPWQPEATLTATTGPASFDYFGWSVAISGDRAIVGAVEDYSLVGGTHLGSAYVFVRNGSTWTEEAKLTPSTGVAFARFGYAVAISGDTAIVGAPFGGDQTGKAYVYRNDPGTKQWLEEVQIGGAVANDRFGYSVALGGDTAVVGSYPLGANRTQGGAYAFTRTGTTWSAPAVLVASDQAAGDIFGFSVAISGDTTIVGAPGKPPQGAAYVFTRSGEDWIQQGPKLTGSGGVAQDFFGGSVAISGDTAVVQFLNQLNAGNRGAYFFLRLGNTWAEQQKISVPNAGSHLGKVGISGDTAIVGTSIYARSGASWSEQATFSVSDGDAASTLGTTGVAINGETAIVGAYGADVGTKVNQGSAYVFVRPDTDGDGLPNDWEINGVTVDGAFIDLPAMGADPLHKDVFVHVDWMAPDAGRHFEPDARALRMVIDSFAAAPVGNPDGRNGIELHLDLGPTSIMKYVTGGSQPWGALSRAGQVPFQDILDPSPVSSIASAKLALAPMLAVHFDPAHRSPVFHYALYANILEVAGSGGFSVGAKAASIFTVAHSNVATPIAEAGTFMHELGHNLGLDHGGGDEVNYKPNYLSIMNYRFQVVGTLRPDGRQRALDFSRRKLDTLNELDLDELVGINDPDGHLTTWNSLTRPFGPANKCISNLDLFYRLFYPTDALDWDCDGVKTLATLQADLNSDGRCIAPGADADLDSAAQGDDVVVGPFIMSGPNRICDSTAAGDDAQLQKLGFAEPALLEGFDDWARPPTGLVYDGDGSIGKLAGKARQTARASADTSAAPHEPSFAELIADLPPGLLADEATAPLDVVTVAPRVGGSPLAVTFNGSASTAVDGTIVTWAWSFGDGTTGSGASVTHTYQLPGEYFASLTVTDSHGRVNLVPLLERVVVIDGSIATKTPKATPTATGTATRTPTPTRTATRTATPPGATPVQTASAGATPAATTTPASTTSSAPTAVPPPSSAPTSTPSPSTTPVPTATSSLTTGDPDPTFNPTVTSQDGEAINAAIVQPDGKIIVGGNFESYGGYARRNIARIMPDGSTDPAFDPGLLLTDLLSNYPNADAATRRSLEVYALALQPDGRILVGVQATRGFKDDVATISDMIYRLNADGSRDLSFDADGFGPFTPLVVAIVLQPDGKILVGGSFTYGVDGRRSSLARLNADGSLDPTFNLEPGATHDGPAANGGTQGGSVSALALQPDGKVIVGGFFTKVGNVGKSIMARLESDGSLDTSFNVDNATGFNIAATPVVFALQPGGKILVGGNLFNANDGKTLPLVRLNADGSRDASFSSAFDATGFGSNTAAHSLAIQTDGKIVIGGFIQNATRHSIARLHPDGTLDASFDTGSGMSGHFRHNAVTAVALQANGKVIVAGNFDTFNGARVEGIVRLEQDGSRDQTFESNGTGRSTRVQTVVRQPDGKLLVGFIDDGFVSKVNRARRGGLGRINANGTLDESFTSPFDLRSHVTRMLLQPDGKILVVGDLRLVGSPPQAVVGVPRLNPDGTIDPTFNALALPLFVQPDGKILAVAGIPFADATEFVRLNADGSRDATFVPHFLNHGHPDLLVMQPDGRLIITGIFFLADGTPARIARLNADGTFDPTFDPGSGPDEYVRALVLQPDGKILIAGQFTSYDGTVRNRIARLDADGSLDTAFDPVNPADRNVGTLALQPDGKILAGIQNQDNDAALGPIRVFRLNANGALDPSFPIDGTGIEPVSGAVNAMVLEPDGNLVIGGGFDVVNGTAHLALARLFGGTPTGPAAALDAFLFYKVKTTKGTAKLAPLGPITLADALTTTDVDVQTLAALGLPADTDAAGITDEGTHLVDYVLKTRKGGSKFRPILDVRVQNLCSDLVVTVAKLEHLLVPANLDLHDPVLPLDAAAHEVADFRCYQVKLQKKRADGTPLARFPKGMQVDVDDQFQSRRYELKKLSRLCFPVAQSGSPAILKTGEPFPFTPAALRHATVQLACYRVKPAKNLIAQQGCRPIDPNDKGVKILPAPPKHEKRLGLQVNGRLGPGSLDTANELELCIPSTVDPG